MFRHSGILTIHASLNAIFTLGGAYYINIYGISPWGLNIDIVGPSLELIDLVNGLHEAPFPLYKLLSSLSPVAIYSNF